MEKISIGTNEKKYEIQSIHPIIDSVMQIIFSNEIPSIWGDIILYTEDGTVATTLTGYETLYRDEGQKIYLSNDGSVYQEPESPGEILPPEPYEPTLQELQASKKEEVAGDCQRIIYAGVNVQLLTGIEHFSLTEHDQLNLFGKQAQLASGATQLEYHADGQPCRYYTAQEMLQIIQTAMWHVSYHTTYCNAINMWIAGCLEPEEVQAIFYGANVPEEYQSDVLKAYLVEIVAMVEDTNEAQANK